MTEFQRLHIDLSQTLEPNAAKKLADPPGFSTAAGKEIDVGGASSRKGQTELASTVKRQNALFAMATAPWKNVAMMSFMMYMAGTQLHFFSIMATINGLYSPFNAILKSGQMFQPDPEGKLNIGGPRLVFCLLHAGGLAFALYRIHLMGLLPTHLSDWIAVIQAPATNDLAVTGLLRGPWG